MSSTYRQDLEAYLKGVAVRSERVLDVGGAQLPVRDRLGKIECMNYVIMDLPQPHENRGYVGIKHDLNFPIEEGVYGGLEPFDTVFCLEVMEYIWNPVVATRNLAELTCPGGILYITFPYYYPPHEPLQEDSLRYTLGGATRLLSMAGFEVLEVEPRRDRGYGLRTAIEVNKLRPSKSATVEEALSLGFIIKAKKI